MSEVTFNLNDVTSERQEKPTQHESVPDIAANSIVETHEQTLPNQHQLVTDLRGMLRRLLKSEQINPNQRLRSWLNQLNPVNTTQNLRQTIEELFNREA